MHLVSLLREVALCFAGVVFCPYFLVFVLAPFVCSVVSASTANSQWLRHTRQTQSTDVLLNTSKQKLIKVQIGETTWSPLVGTATASVTRERQPHPRRLNGQLMCATRSMPRNGPRLPQVAASISQEIDAEPTAQDRGAMFPSLLFLIDAEQQIQAT